MLELLKIRKDINWLIDQVKCLIRKSDLDSPLSATAWTSGHSEATGDPYIFDSFAWYEGNVYKSLINNNIYPPTNATYWADLGKGHLLLEDPSIPTLQEVTTAGNTTSNKIVSNYEGADPAIYVTNLGGKGILSITTEGAAIVGTSYSGVGGGFSSEVGNGANISSFSGIGAEIYSDNGIGAKVYSGSGTGINISSFVGVPAIVDMNGLNTSNIIEFKKNSVNQAYITSTGTIVSNKLLVNTTVDNGVDSIQVIGSIFSTLDAKINGLTVGRGSGNIDGNTVIGYQSLFNNVSGVWNTAIGYRSLLANTTGSYNTSSGHSSLISNTTGYDNAAFGYQTLRANLTGIYNTAIGSSALKNSISGSNNTAVGFQSLFFNTTGSSNSAIGWLSLLNNTTGSNNVANGQTSLYSNTTGSLNVGIGLSSLRFNTTGICNTAIGTYSSFNNSIGNFNLAVGYQALRSNIADKNTAIGVETMYSNTAGTFNTAVGQEALRANTTGSENVAIGNFALLNASSFYATAIGRNAGRYSSLADLTSIYKSVFIGFQAKSLNVSSTNEIVIGADAVGLGNNTTVLGNTSTVTTAIYGKLLLGTTVGNVSDTLQVNGSILATTIKKSGGTSLQYLMADGSVSTDAIRPLLNVFPDTSVAGTVTETLLATITIPANTFPTTCMPTFLIRMSKSGDVGASTVRLRFSTTNNPATATTLATYIIPPTIDSAIIGRNPIIKSGAIRIGVPTSTFLSEASQATSTESVIPFNVTVPIFLFVLAANDNVSDITTLRSFKITN